MTLYVNEAEALWFVVSLATFVLTLFALADAWIARSVVKSLNGHAREIAANGNIRREGVRLIVQTLLLIVVIPSLFSDYPITLSPPSVALIAVPVMLFVNSVMDTVDRRKLIGAVAREVEAESIRTLGRIEVAITANTELTQVAADQAGEDRVIQVDTNATAHRIDERVP